MNQHNNSNPKRSLARRAIRAAALVAALGATAFAGASFAGEGMHGRHGGAHPMAMDPAKAAKHIEKMIARIAPDATAQQKARLTEIATSAFADLQPMRGQMRDAHQRVHELLRQPVIDRAALEALRVEQVQRVDALSKRMLTAVTDAADILTPEQRARFAEHLQKRMHH